MGTLNPFDRLWR